MTQQKFPPNEGQAKAIEDFFKFMLDPYAKRHILSGPGGVGKTFTMGEMIDTVIPRYMEMCQLLGVPIEYDNVVMTATTNKAVEALSKATGRPAKTIQSFLCLRPKENYQTGEMDLIRTPGWMEHDRLVIFIDECSMIDRNLFAEIEAATARCKVVYVGDHVQLPPVKETISKIYSQQYGMSELTQPMRTDVPELQALNEQFRQVVLTGVHTDIKIVPGIIDWMGEDEAMDEIDRAFTNGNREDRILCYSNPQVMAINDYIRSLRQLPAEFVVGETLVSNSAYQNSKKKDAPRISIEDELIVLEVGSIVQTALYDDDIAVEFRDYLMETPYGEHINVPQPVDRDYFNQCLAYYKGKKNWKAFYKLKETYPDLRQRDAATVHKSQGSSYTTSYVDLGNISTCHLPGMAARLMYVAFSRARKRVVLFGDLHPKFGKLIF